MFAVDRHVRCNRMTPIKRIRTPFRTCTLIETPHSVISLRAADTFFIDHITDSACIEISVFYIKGPYLHSAIC